MTVRRALAALFVPLVAACIEPRALGDRDAAAIDAPSGDAPDSVVDGAAPIDGAFGLEHCPALYTIEIGTSRYRFRGPDTFFNHYGACREESDGYTHLAVVSDGAEAAALRADLRICEPVGNCDTFWTGVFAIDGTTFVSGTGETPFYTAWAAGQPGDLDEPPTAMTFSPRNGDTTDQPADLDDDPGTVRALCECDGRPAQALLRSDFE